MTVVHPNAVSGINSITVQTGNSLSIHKADGSLIRTITGSTGVTTFATISVGSAYTDFAQGGGLNIGLGASISNGSGNVLTFGTGGDDRATIDASGNLVHGGGSSRSAVGGAQLVQVEGLTASAGFSAVRNSNDAHGPYISLAKSRGTALGAVTVIQDDDDLGAIRFGGGDGTDIASEGARIEATVDGTPGSNDIPTRLTFQTTADGAAAPTERLRITSGGLVGINTDTIGTNHNLEIFGNAGAYAVLNVKSQSLSHGASIELGAQDDDNYGSITQFASGASEGGRMKFVAGTTETMNLRGGNVLIGDSAGAVGKLSTLGTGNHISASRHSTDTSASNFIFAKYRGSRSSPTVVADGDDLGNLSWYGYNGSSIIKAADITAKTAGTVDGSNMTTDLVFSTTTGNTSTERFRIQSDGTVQIGTQSAHTKWVEFADSSRDDATEIRVNNGSNSDFEVVNNRSGGKIKLYTNSSSRFEIDGDGYITNPGKRAAAFCARCSSTFNVSQNGIVKYNTTSAGSNDYQAFDIGSNYSTSTGKFTCPVDGVYYFEAQAMTTGWANGNSMQDLLIMKSNRGTVSNPRQRRSWFRSDADNNGYYTNSVSGLYNGSAGDTVWIIVAHACGISNLSYSYFSGYLVA